MENNKPRRKFHVNNFDNFSNFKKKKKFERKPQSEGMTVTVYNDDVMKAWRILKRKMTDADILQEIKDRRYYEKPSEKKRKKRQLAARNEQRRQMKQAEMLGIKYKNYDPLAQSYSKKHR